ncbi:MAG: ATP-binding protein [Gammaproteobacteria bacterium]|nr:ATP-binding protein [Gammaproteobacteria bacterium]
MPISDDSLLPILESWSFWSKKPPNSIPRLATNSCVLKPDLVTVIQGVRRCGKSTLLQQIAKTNNIPIQSAIFINFEDPRLINCLDHTLLEQIYRLCKDRFPHPLTFFLDEIQNVAYWQKWLNSKLERPEGHSFVVTGSNSRLLSGELATSLTGRHVSIELFPFNFMEYQRVFKKGELSGFLKMGGFPAVLNYPEPEKLLQQYFQDIVERDIRERVSAKSSHPLRAVAQMIFESIGSELSLRKIAGAINISHETVNLYLHACEEAYLLFSCPYFAYSEAKRIRRNKKYYVIDTALRRSVSTKAGTDMGKDFENLVYLSLRQKATEIYYWRGKGEVDFVVNTNNGVTPIQVTYEKLKPHHEDALMEFYSYFPHANEALIVTPESFIELTGLDL